MLNFQNLSDKELYIVCKKWGADVLAARRKFAGLLPEVQRREIASWKKGGSWLKKRGFFDMYDFAARLAGMSQKQVDEVIRQDRSFEDKPVLRAALVNGEVSVNKLARVVSIATVENQAEILEKVKELSKVALDCFVKDFKRENGIADELEKLQDIQNVNGLHKPQGGKIMSGLQMPQNGQMSLYVQNENAVSWHEEAIGKTGFEHGGNSVNTRLENDDHEQSKKLSVNLDEDIAKELLEMMEKGIDVNELLREFLHEKKEKHEREKERVAEKQKQEASDRAIIGFPAKRYVPVEVRRVVLEEFGSRCSMPGCGKLSVNLHHEKGFAKDQCHDPRYLKPLCSGHHELAHSG